MGLKRRNLWRTASRQVQLEALSASRCETFTIMIQTMQWLKIRHQIEDWSLVLFPLTEEMNISTSDCIETLMSASDRLKPQVKKSQPVMFQQENAVNTRLRSSETMKTFGILHIIRQQRSSPRFLLLCKIHLRLQPQPLHLFTQPSRNGEQLQRSRKVWMSAVKYETRSYKWQSYKDTHYLSWSWYWGLEVNVDAALNAE